MRTTRSSILLSSNYLFAIITGLAALITPVVFAAGTVGNGSAVSCTEAALNTALSGGGTVNFNCGAAPVTILLTSTKTLTVATTLDGGNLITLDGGGSVQHFITGNAPTFTVQNISLVNGSAEYGGAIYANWAGNTLVVTNSTFSNNKSVNGGGAIRSFGATLTISGSTFNGNSVTNVSGAAGGAIEHQCTTASISNSTFSANGLAGTAAGAISAEQGTTTITSSTFAGNIAEAGSAAVVVSGSGSSLTLRNTILSANLAANCLAFNSGILTDFGNNLQFGGTANSCGAGITSANPLLGSLANNGGPTKTIALLTGSPAINAGSTCPSADQRGVARSGVCDIGAYEYIPAAVSGPATPVPTLSNWGLLVLAGLMGIIALVFARRRAIA